MIGDSPSFCQLLPCSLIFVGDGGKDGDRDSLTEACVDGGGLCIILTNGWFIPVIACTVVVH